MTDQAVSRTTAERIMASIREIADPADDAGALALAFSSVAMMLEQHLPEAISQAEQDGELGEIVIALTRWFASHLGDDGPRLLVVELPRRRDLPPATRLHQMRLAEELPDHPRLPF